MYKRILVPLDGSELAEVVLPHVRALAQCMDSEIILLRVAAQPIYDYAFADPLLGVRIREQVEAETIGYLHRTAASLKQAGFKVTTQVGAGLVPDAILDAADSLQADLIAMSTHGRSGIARWLMGSVADKVVHGAQVPVLLIRPTQAD